MTILPYRDFVLLLLLFLIEIEFEILENTFFKSFYLIIASECHWNIMELTSAFLEIMKIYLRCTVVRISFKHRSASNCSAPMCCTIELMTKTCFQTILQTATEIILPFFLFVFRRPKINILSFPIYMRDNKHI